MHEKTGIYEILSVL